MKLGSGILIGVCCLAVGAGIGYRLGQQHAPVGLPATNCDAADSFVASVVLPRGGTATQPARRVYHRADCRFARRIDPENRAIFASSQAAEADGYAPCKRCLH